MTRFLPLIGMFGGYVLLMFFNPVRLSFRDGLRCITRYERIWLTFALLGIGYAVFQLATFTPLHTYDFDARQIGALNTWHWPNFMEIWRDVPLPTLESVAGIFDNATATFPVSVLAAILLVVNWRGLHGTLLRALRKRYGLAGFLIYLAVLISAFATLLKPVIFWRLPEWQQLVPTAKPFQISATVDAVAFIFEYLLGVYLQVYLITVCLAWIRGLSFTESALFQFAVRRFAFVLEWALVVLAFSIVIVRVPLLLGYFREMPVLDFFPAERYAMVALIILFSSMQISLVLHNETLGAAFRAHRQFLRRDLSRFGWFVLVVAFHFFLLVTLDAITRGAIGDRNAALLIWKPIFVLLRAFVTGWMLASWVCLFRQCETARIGQERWVAY